MRHDPCLFVGCPDPDGRYDSACHIFNPLRNLGKWNHPLQTAADRAQREAELAS